jgi:PAS domain S-box-containing protein
MPHSQDHTEAAGLAHLAAIVAGSSDAIISKTPSGIVQSWNAAAERMFGYTAAEMIGGSIRALIPADQQHEEDAFLESIARGEAVRNFATQRVRKDGSLFPVSLTISPIRSGSGEIVGASKIMRDLTEQEQMLRRLSESEERVRVLADNISQLAWMADAKGDIFWYNQRWYDYTGTTLEDVAGWGWRRVHHPDHVERVTERIQHSWNTGDPWEDTFPLRGADGEYRWFLSRALPIRNADGEIVRWFGTNTDVTDQMRQQEKIELLMNEVNHRAKNTLALVQAIARQAATTKPEREFVDKFSQRIVALAVSQDLLVTNDWRGTDIAALIRGQLAHFADSLNTRIVLDGPPLQLTTPAAQVLGMALHELATNASKYGSLSNETGRVHISWRSAPIEDRFEIEWVESGGPIVATPRRKGFGSVVMDKMARLGLSADIVLEFAPKGLIWRLACAREAALYVPPTAAGLEIAKS